MYLTQDEKDQATFDNLYQEWQDALGMTDELLEQHAKQEIDFNRMDGVNANEMHGGEHDQ